MDGSKSSRFHMIWCQSSDPAHPDRGYSLCLYGDRGHQYSSTADADLFSSRGLVSPPGRLEYSASRSIIRQRIMPSSQVSIHAPVVFSLKPVCRDNRGDSDGEELCCASRSLRHFQRAGMPAPNYFESLPIQGWQAAFFIDETYRAHLSYGVLHSELWQIALVLPAPYDSYRRHRAFVQLRRRLDSR